jgi:hypothetical protein
MSPTTCFQEIPLRPRLTTPRYFSLEEGYLFVGRSCGAPGMEAAMSYPNHTQENWAIAQLILIMNISLFGIIQ